MMRADLGRAGEGNAGDAAVSGEHGADLAVARHQMQRARRHAGRVQQLYRFEGDQRRLLGGLGHHRIAGGERAGDLAGKNRQREIPRADADENAAAAVAQFVALAGRPRQRAAARACGAPAPRNSGKNRPPRALPRRSRRASCRPRFATARSAGRDFARSGRRRAPARPRARRPASHPSGKAGLRRRHRRGDDRLVALPAPCRWACRRSARDTSRARPATATPSISGAAIGIRAAPRRSRPAAHRARRDRRIRRRPNCAAPGANRSRGSGICGWRACAGSAIQLCGRFSRSSTGTSGSAATETKEELAPFSSSRRTR